MNSLSKFFITGFLFFAVCTHVQAQFDEFSDDFLDIERRLDAVENNLLILNRVSISGYIQTQFAWGEKDAHMWFGVPNENPENPYNRFGLRRGRLRFGFEEGIASAVFQIDMIERGINFRDAFVTIRDPFWGSSRIRAGLFFRPFGYDISRSSAIREAPERAVITTTLFPSNRDIGWSVNLQAPRTSVWHFLRFEGGWFAGNGISQQVDSNMDFICRLAMNKVINSNLRISGGVSYYNGGVFQGTDSVFTMSGNHFVLDNNPANRGRYAKREYLGFDAQISINTSLGLTKFMGEYIFGQQPGRENRNRSPNTSTLPNWNTFIRPVSGGYITWVQDLGRLPFSAVLRYDWHNPNTAVSGNDIGRDRENTHTGEADRLQTTYGFGILWEAAPSVRVTAFYEIVNREFSEHTMNFEGDKFTLRLQYRF